MYRRIKRANDVLDEVVLTKVARRVRITNKGTGRREHLFHKRLKNSYDVSSEKELVYGCALQRDAQEGALSNRLFDYAQGCTTRRTWVMFEKVKFN